MLPFNENKKGFHLDNPDCEIEVPHFVKGPFFVRCRINEVLPAAGYAPSAGFAGNDWSHLTPATYLPEKLPVLKGMVLPAYGLR